MAAPDPVAARAAITLAWAMRVRIRCLSASVSLDAMIALPLASMDVVRLDSGPFHELAGIVRKGIEAIRRIVTAAGIQPEECLPRACR